MTIAVAGIVAMLLQTTIFPAGLAPHLLLVLVVYLGVHQYDAWGALGAFVLGYFLDTFSGTLLGMHAFTFTAVYLGVHHVARVLWTEGGLPAALVTFGAAVVNAVLVLVITALTTSGDLAVWRHAVRYGLLEATTAAALTAPVVGVGDWEQP